MISRREQWVVDRVLGIIALAGLAAIGIVRYELLIDPVVALSIADTDVSRTVAAAPDGWFGFVVPLLVGSCLQDAFAAVEDERDRLIAERDAFRRFADEVETVEAQVGQPVGTATVVAQSGGDRRALRSVRERYRETVMAVPHYEAEYDENLRENVAAEFDWELATAVTDGRNFSPQLKQLLVHRARLAARDREELRTTIERERESLAETEALLRETERTLREARDGVLRERSFSGLVDVAGNLGRAIDRCERSLEDRQSEIHRIESEWGCSDRSYLYPYLYADLEVMHPALDAVLDRIRTLRDRRREVVRFLMRRS